MNVDFLRLSGLETIQAYHQVLPTTDISLGGLL